MPEAFRTRDSVQAMPRVRAPARDHPQEAELQRFKQEFTANDVNQQLEEKKRKVRATLDKARLALSQGVVAAEPKHKKFMESKEFVEAMEFLQCNKDFIFQFLQQKPHVVFSKNDGIPSPVTPRLKKKEKSQAPRDSTERGFSPRAFARLFIPTSSRKRNDDKKQQPVDAIATLNPTAILRPGSKDITSEDAKRKTGSCISSRYLLPASPKAQSKHESSKTTDKKSGTRDVKHFLRRQSGEGAQTIKAKLRGSKALDKALEACSSPNTSTNFTLTKTMSTGKRISMMRPDEDDMGISTPKAVRTADPTSSPAKSRAKLTKTKTMTTTTTNGLASEISQREAVKTPTRRSVETTTRSHVSPCKTLDPASLTRCRSVPNMAMLRERGPCGNGDAKSADSSKLVRSKSSNQKTLGFFSVGKSKGSKVGHEAPEEAMPALPTLNPKPCVSQRNAGCLNGKDSKVRRNILGHVKSGRKSNEHSSSVSVLELPESPPGVQEFRDISNDLQDPQRIRLRRSHLDESSKRLRTNELDPTKGRVLNQVDGNNERVRDTDFGIRRERHHVKVPQQSVQRPSNAERPLLQTLNLKPAERFALQTLNPKPSQDFAFVCDTLVASGFHTHGGRNITRWHSATQPISPHLIVERLGKGSHPRRAAALFDAINEVLVAKLEVSAVKPDQCFGLPIVGASNSAVRGRRFVEEVWGEIQKRQYPVGVGVAGCDEEEEYLHGLVAQDLATTSSWSSLRCEVDRVCLQVERAMWNDLMDELCSGLLSVN